MNRGGRLLQTLLIAIALALAFSTHGFNARADGWSTPYLEIDLTETPDWRPPLYQLPIYGDSFVSGWTGDGLVDGQVQTSVSGPVKATLTWDGGSNNNPPPANVYLLVQPTASISVSMSGYNDATSAAYSPSADDGFGDPLVESIATFSSFPYWSIGYSGVSVGKHLVEVDGASGTATYSGSLTAQIAVHGSNTDFGFAQSSISCSVAIDKRGLTASCSADPTWYKFAQVDTQGNPVTDEFGNQCYIPRIHLNAPDGSMQGDIGITDFDVSNQETTDVTYHANRIGPWHIDGSVDTWTSSLTTDSQTDLLPIYGIGLNIPDFGVSYLNSVGGTRVFGYDVYGDPIFEPSRPGETGVDTIKLSYADGSDGAKADTCYVMHVHNPYENPFIYRPDTFEMREVSATAAAPGTCTTGESITVTYTASGADTSGDVGSYVWTSLFPILQPYLQALLTAANLDPSHLQPETASPSVGFNSLWEHPTPGTIWVANGLITNCPPAGASETDPAWTFKPEMECNWKTSHVRSDHYAGPGDSSGYSGFAGQVNQTFDARDGNVIPYGTFYYTQR